MRPRRRRPPRPLRRRSRRSRKSLLLVFALVFAAAARSARAACVEFASPPAITTAANGARSVFVADVDGNGVLDVLSASAADKKIAWYKNLGDGSGWSQHAISTTGDFAVAVVAADLDGDGDLDVASASLGDSEIVWNKNLTGDGTSWSQQTISIAIDTPEEIFAADVDGDGDIDLLSASYFDDLIAWHENVDVTDPGTGNGSSWSLQTISVDANGAFGVAAADVDGDGDLDALSSSGIDQAIAWYENPRKPDDGSIWTLHEIWTQADGAFAVLTGDVDADGDVDVLSTSQSDDTIAWYENRPPGNGSTWSVHEISTLADRTLGAFAADLDGDGDLDALSSTRYGEVAWYENDGTPAVGGWTKHTLATNVTESYTVVVGDLDGDGDADVLADSFDTDSVVWFRNDRLHGDALFATLSTIAPGTGPLSFSAHDVDGDGDTDLFSSYSASVVWEENEGEGASWTIHLVKGFLSAQRVVVGADVDGDGDADAVAASQAYSGDLFWYANDGSGGGWTQHTVVSTPGFVQSLAAADFDRDGDLDLAATMDPLNDVVWYENDDPVNAASWAVHTVATNLGGAYAAAPADVDGDGDSDLFVAARTADAVVWYQSSSDGDTWTLFSVGSGLDGAIALFAADLDGDGDVDVVSASYFDDQVVWFENDGTPLDDPQWTAHSISTTAVFPYSVWAADFDGDGDLDVLAAFAVDDEVAWYENVDGEGDVWATRTIALDFDDAFAVTAADLDGDGHSDALALSASSFDGKIAWYPNLGTHVHDDGFDSDGATTACWSTSNPPVP